MQATRNGGELTIGAWTVAPHLNRIRRDDLEIQLEPKMMDVLVLLASRAGQVVSKDEIDGTVWSDVLVTESVITRAIAGLRRALGDNARSPCYIETIAKRGYRLIASVETDEASSPPPADAHPAPSTPWVVGQWVRGARFYGRRDEVRELLHAPRRCHWVLGLRRCGKTSLLKELERISTADPRRLPLYWDLQGCGEVDELNLDFADALLDSEADLQALGIDPREVVARDLFATLGALRRRLVSVDVELVLLLDEAETLLRLTEDQERLPDRLRSALHAGEGIRTVLASGPRLWTLGEAPGDTSPFLGAFTPPLILGPLDPTSARALVRQQRVDPAQRPRFDDDLVDEVCHRTGRHPYLLQLVGKRLHELGDLEVVLDELAAERSVHQLFTADLSLLDGVQRGLVQGTGAGPLDPTSLPEEHRGAWRFLLGLGIVRRTDDGLVAGNELLARWLAIR